MAQITLTLDLSHETVEALHALVDKLPAKRERVPYTNQYADEANSSEPSGQLSTPESNEKSATTTKRKTSKPKTAKPEEDRTESSSSAETETENPKDAPSLTDVRAVALKFSKAGKQSVLKNVFAKYGAEKLSDIPASKYPALMADLEAANG